MSLLRIIFGVLVGVGVFVGLAFLGSHMHTGISFARADYIGRCLDNAVWLGIGIVGLLYYPWKIRRDIKADILTEAKGKSRLSQVRMISCFAIAVGVLRILRVLP